MLHRTPPTTDISRRSHAQRRLRRAAGHRLFCSTNGCPTLLVPDEDGHSATCPICGLNRRISAATEQPSQHRAH